MNNNLKESALHYLSSPAFNKNTLVDITEIDLATIENNDYKLYNKNIYILLKIKNRINVLNTNFNNQKCNRI